MYFSSIVSAETTVRINVVLKRLASQRRFEHADYVEADIVTHSGYYAPTLPVKETNIMYVQGKIS